MLVVAVGAVPKAIEQTESVLMEMYRVVELKAVEEVTPDVKSTNWSIP